MGIALSALVLRVAAPTQLFRCGLPVAGFKPQFSSSRSGQQSIATWAGLNWIWLLLMMLSANAADFDFLPGLIVGDFNRWHHTGSHSLVAVVVWAGFVAATLSYWQRRGSYQGHPQCWVFALCAAAAYASHLLMDWLTQDTRPPIGIPLLWPIDQYSLSSWTPLGGVRHGVPGDDLGTVLGEVLSLHNAKVALRECFLVAPVCIILWVTTRPTNR